MFSLSQTLVHPDLNFHFRDFADLMFKICTSRAVNPPKFMLVGIQGMLGM
jgi:hypothetical protein